MHYSDETKTRARVLRNESKTYEEIQVTLGLKIPKATLAYWFRDLGIKAWASRPQLRAAHMLRIQKMAQETKTARREEWARGGAKEAADLRAKLNDDRLFWLFLGLYWGEGSKTTGFTFTNADASAIKACLRFLDIMGVPHSKLRAAVHVHTDIDRDLAVEYWKDVTGLERVRAYNVNKAADAPKRATLRYGTLHLHVGDADFFRRMKAWLSGLGDEFGGEDRASMRIPKPIAVDRLVDI